MQVEFVFVAEAGVLERQSLLLAESIRAFGGRYAAAAITVLHPRPDRPLAAATRQRLQALDARIVAQAIDPPLAEYGPSIRVHAFGAYEPVSRADILVCLDSDMLLLAEPDFELGDADAAVRPVDVKGMCTSGPADPHDAYWRRLCRLCNVDYDRIPWIVTTVDGVRVRASYNGGLTVSRRRAGLHACTEDFFGRAYRANLVPWPDRDVTFATGHGVVSGRGGQHWGSSQACLSLAITALGLSVRVLPPTHNFPLHSYADLPPERRPNTAAPIALVHYHHLFRDAPLSNPILGAQPGFPETVRPWLRQRVDDFA